MTQLNNINNTFESYQKLIDFYHEHKGKIFENIELDLTKWFAANMCSALGGILDLFSDGLNEIKFNHVDPKIKEILLKNNFLSYFGQNPMVDKYHTTIRFLKLKPTDGKFFNGYVVNELLARTELPQMSQMVKEKIAEIIYEIFVNAQIHSDTKYIYTCGQFFPRENKIEFTITDTGIGFNKGKMQIISSNGFYQFDVNGEQTHLFNGDFPGTIVNLQFKTDDNQSYILKSESSSSDIF